MELRDLINEVERGFGGEAIKLAEDLRKKGKNSKTNS